MPWKQPARQELPAPSPATTAVAVEIVPSFAFAVSV